MCPPGSGVDKPIGEVSIQLELHTQPGSGERKVTIKGPTSDHTVLNLFPF